MRGARPERIGDVAFEHGIRIHELAPRLASLEEAFMEMTKDDVEYRAVAPGSAARTGDRPHELIGA